MLDIESVLSVLWLETKKKLSEEENTRDIFFFGWKKLFFVPFF